MNLKLQEFLRNLRNPRSKSFWALVFVVVYSAAGFLLLPWLLKDQLPTVARDYINREASVVDISFNPWSLELIAKGLEIQDERNEPFLQLEQLYVNLQVSSLFYRALKFREIALTNPDIRITRYTSGDSNIALLIEDYNAASATAEPTAAETESTEPFRLVIDKLGISEGKIKIEDQVPANEFAAELTPININVENLSTLPDDQGEQTIKLRFDGGSEIELAGSLQLNPLLASGSLNLVGSPVPTVKRYLDDQLNFRLRDRAFAVAFNFAVREADDQSISASVNDLAITIDDITAESQDGSQRYFSIPRLGISGGEIAWPEQSVRIAEISLTEPAVNVEIGPDGSLNLEALATATATSGVDEAESGVETPAPDESDAAAADWLVTVDAFRIDKLSALFRDLSLAEPGELSIAALNLLVSNITTAPEQSGTFALDTTIATGGRFDATGEFVVLPELSASAAIEFSELGLAAAQPWAADAATVVINNGQLGAAGNIEISNAEAFGWEGDVQLTNLDISDSSENETLAGVKRLAVNQSRLSLSENELEISSIEIEAPFARVIINQDASTNFGNLATAEDTAADAKPVETEAAGDTFVIKVGKTSVEDGSVDFSDFSLPLPFRALITDFSGGVSAIASNSMQPSVVDFDGRVGDYGQANVDGSVSILDPTNQTEIDLIFRNVSMPDLTPYTVEFAGRAIEEGKLDLDLKYSFTDNKMVGDNKIVLTTFRLGKEVESENAMSLPLDIAVALLKDVNGVIDLNLQVKGDLDDPSFSVGGIVLKALANLIIKAAAAPFKLLGALVPGMGDEEDIGTLRFAAGEAKLLPPEREKLDNLAAALGQRPNLSLKIPAGYAVEADSESLRAAAISALVEAEIEGSTDDAQLTEQTRKALEVITRNQLPEIKLREYREQFDIVNPETGAPSFDEVAYMTALRTQLEQQQVIDETELVSLAQQRQTTVVQYLLANQAISPERVLAGEVATAAVEDDRWVTVELALEVGDMQPLTPPAEDPAASAAGSAP